MKIAVLLSGRGSNFIAIHEAISSGLIKDTSIVAVISNKEDAPGLSYAKKAGLNALFVDPKQATGREAYDQIISGLLEPLGVDLICLAGYMRIMSDPFVQRYYGRMINIHPSLLPSFPGLHAQKQALDYGVKVSGCTVHFVDGGMDSGPVIAQTAVPVYDNDTEDKLSARILIEEHKLYPYVISLFAAGKVSLRGRSVITG